MACGVVFFLLQSLLLGLAASQASEIYLNGDDWTLKESLGKLNESVKATVPGQVHLDLMRAGIISDPYENWNDWLYQWIGYDNWTYYKTFEISENDLIGRKVILKCDGLDTIAIISINDKLVGRAHNYHRRYMFDITSEVKAGENVIRVEFESGANYSYTKAAEYPYDLYTDIQGVFFNFSQRGFIRKTQSDFGWDWGIGLAPCGIWGNISVEFVNMAYISDVTPKAYYDEDQAAYFVSVTTCVKLVTDISAPSLAVTATLADIQVAADGVIRLNISAAGEEDCYTIYTKPLPPSMIEEDYFWWPLGVKWSPTREKPRLVEVAVKATLSDSSQDNNVLAGVDIFKNVGFRRIELVQEPVMVNNKPNGRSFYFQIRTADQVYPFFAKGSNFIPMDALVNRATKETAAKLLTSFVEGNQNMLRVWGGGLYQPDWFYDICDELGIMVWQEFMYADALYPRDKDFLENVDAEIKDVVRRLSHHPSIVLWSGNNENQGILGNDSVRIVDYSALYDGVIRTRLWVEDTTRIYWPSSPSNGIIIDDSSRGLYIQRWGDVSDLSYGDIHRYDYNDFCLDVSKFPTPRFISEFGFQSYPSFSSLKKVSQTVDWTNDSPFMTHRNHHPGGNKQMEALIALNFNLPVNDNSMYKFLDFIYLSQVMQGLCIRAQAEHYRRLLSTEGVLTRGTLYWQLNDIWQAQSWSSVEWSGRWKILHYFMQRAYAPILVSPYQTNGSIIVYVVMDVIDHSLEYTLHIQAISWATGNSVNDIKVPGLKSTGFTGTMAYKGTMDTVFQGTSPKESYLVLDVLDSSNMKSVARNWHYPANFTEVNLLDVDIRPSNFSSSIMDDYIIVSFFLLASNPAPFVYLDNTNYDGVFSDNGFMMDQMAPVRVTFKTYTSPISTKTFQAGLMIRSLKDTYSNKPYNIKI